MKKRFVLIMILALLMFLVSCKEKTNISVNIHEEVIDIPGIDNEYNIFFLSDSHISMCDSRDPEVMEKAQSREEAFTVDAVKPEERFDELINVAKKSDNDMVILGGDILDSAMYASIEHLYSQLSTLKSPYLYLMGNHDFEYGKEYFSDVAYNEYLTRFEKMRDGTKYQIREYEDIIFFSADDTNNQIDKEILDAYKSVSKKEKPIVLAMHVPIEPITGDMTLVDKCREVWGTYGDNKSKVTLGINGICPDPVTQEFLDLVLSDDSPVVLVLAGHIHFYHKDTLNNNTVQIVTGPAYKGEAVRITLVGA